MKMEYERYSERYRRNETNGNVGIISEDSEVIRRRTMLQEQQREEMRRIKTKKKKEELRRRRRRKKQAKKIFCLCICVLMLILIVTLMRRAASSKKQEEPDVISSEAAVTEQQSDNTEPSVQATGETAQKESVALPDYYEKKYMVGVPAHYSEDEIETRLKTLSEFYPEFETIYNHKDQYPEALLNNLCCNPNMLDFALGYPEKYDTTSVTLEKSELEDAIPLFIQWDKRWGYDAYGDDVIGLSGCGPTCLSMVIVGLTKNQDATPDKLADYAMEHGYYENNSGTKWSFMDEVAAVYGVHGYYIRLSMDAMQEELEQGHPIICAMRSGDFTSQGHFIVISGMEGDQFRVRDPNSIERSQKLWDYDTLRYQISAIWAFQIAD